MARVLTKKQKGFVKDYAKTGNGRLAAENNYNVSSKESARVVASEVLTSPNVIKALAERLPDDLLSERHLELLNKRELYTWYEDVKDEETKQVIEVIPHHIDLGPDVQAVTKGLDMAFKVKGSYAPEKSESRTLNVEVKLENKDLVAVREKFEEELKAKLNAKS